MDLKVEAYWILWYIYKRSNIGGEINVVNIAVLGYGTVGSGVVELLDKNKELIKNENKLFGGHKWNLMKLEAMIKIMFWKW